jgi:hypothetical protein
VSEANKKEQLKLLKNLCKKLNRFLKLNATFCQEKIRENLKVFPYV